MKYFTKKIPCPTCKGAGVVLAPAKQGKTIGQHIIGTHLINPETRHGFINIPKNATTWLKTVTQRRGYEYHIGSYDFQPDIEFTVIIREPWERYLSGVAEYVRRYYLTPEMLKEQYNTVFYLLYVVQWWKKYNIYGEFPAAKKHRQKQPPTSLPSLGIFDEHSMPQYAFIHPFSHNTLEYVKMDAQNYTVLEEKLKKYLGESKIPKFQRHRTSIAFQKLIKYLDIRLKQEENKKWYKMWNEIYQNDYRLFNRAL